MRKIRRKYTVACGLPALLCCLALAFTGCKSTLGGGSQRITELHLIGTPVALNLDKVPGPDGVGVRVYASAGTKPNAVRISSGTLEIHLYDGRLTSEQAAAATPLASFTYESSQLRALEHETAVGTSYNFLPRWGDHRPATDRVTVVGVYTAPGQAPVRSRPITVPMTRP